MFKKKSGIYKTVSFFIIETMRNIDSSNFDVNKLEIIKNEMQSLLRNLNEITLPKNVVISSKNMLDSYSKLIHHFK